MKSFQLILLCFICIAKSYGQNASRSYGRIVVEITKEKKSSKVTPKVEIKSFINGDSSLVQSIEQKIIQSLQTDKKIKTGKYIVSVRFIVTKNGSYADIVCETDPSFGMCEKVIAAIRGSQKWIPAEQGNQKIRQYGVTHQ
jgi:hypothetical protein